MNWDECEPDQLLCHWSFFSLFRLPIAFDLLVLKRQWKSFITWSFIALLLLLVRI